MQKTTTIRARLLGPVHRIFYHPSAPLGQLNIAQIVGVKRATLFHTLLTPKARGDTLTWVVDAYDILGIHRMQALQEASLHPEAS